MSQTISGGQEKTLSTLTGQEGIPLGDKSHIKSKVLLDLKDAIEAAKPVLGNLEDVVATETDDGIVVSSADKPASLNSVYKVIAENELVMAAALVDIKNSAGGFDPVKFEQTIDMESQSSIFIEWIRENNYPDYIDFMGQFLLENQLKNRYKDDPISSYLVGDSPLILYKIVGSGRDILNSCSGFLIVFCTGFGFWEIASMGHGEDDSDTIYPLISTESTPASTYGSYGLLLSELYNIGFYEFTFSKDLFEAMIYGLVKRALPRINDNIMDDYKVDYNSFESLLGFYLSTSIGGNSIIEYSDIYTIGGTKTTILKFLNSKENTFDSDLNQITKTYEYYKVTRDSEGYVIVTDSWTRDVKIQL